MIAHPRAALPVLDEAADLPEGSGGIVVDVRRSGRVRVAPQIGVDGLPVLYGFGRALIPVAPGRHVVEAQFAEPVGTTEVTVRAGDVVRLVHERAAFRGAGDAVAVPGKVPPLVRLAPRIAWQVLSLIAVLVLVVVPAAAAGAPVALLIPLASVLGIAGFGWLIVRTARVHNALLAPRRPAPRTAAARRGAQRLADDAVVPAPPSGRGAVLLDLRFWASETDADGAAGASFDAWIDPPEVRIDGRTVAAGWSRCWFPLAPGAHDVEVVAPGAARARIEITAGETAQAGYHAQITVGGATTAEMTA